MRIQNNVTALNTHRQYTINNTNVSKNAEKLSSGYRINRAGDDAAGLAISEKMRAQIRGLTMAAKNSNDAISLVQTAEGALQETHNILQRMRELAVQSASDTNETTIDRAALQQEFAQLQQEIDDIAQTTRFNDQNLLNGSYQKLTSSVTSDGGITEAAIIADKAAGGAYSVKFTAVTAAKANVEAGTSANLTGGTVGGVAITGTNTGGTIDLTSVTKGAFSGVNITFTGAATDANNNNTYTIKAMGSTADNMTIQLLDSNNDIVSTAQNVDFTLAAAEKPFDINFAGVGTMSITRGKDAEPIKADALAASEISSKLNGSTLKFGDKGATGETTPAQSGHISISVDGEVVNVKKGDTTAIFQQSGLVLQFEAITDKDIDDVANNNAAKFGAGLTNAEVTVEVGQTVGKTMVIQTGANEGDELSINIDAMDTGKLGISTSSIATRAAASNAITEVNNALNQVSTQRAALGALQNRLDHKIANLNVSAENLTAAESRIRDVDMASEMTNFTKNSILAQAATAMLAQANALPQNVLSLLG